jgi:hypothetical protein
VERAKFKFMLPNGPQATVNSTFASPGVAGLALRVTQPASPGRERMKPPRLESATPGMSDPGRSFELVSK